MQGLRICIATGVPLIVNEFGLYFEALLLTTQQIFCRDQPVLGKIVNYASRQLTQIPVELTLSPSVEQLHLGFNKLEVLNKKFFRLPFLSVLNLDQNLLFDIPKEFKHFSGLTILSLKVLL